MIVAPTIVVQIVAIYVFYYTYVDNISKHMARGVLSEMVFIRNSINIKGNKELVRAFSRSIDLKFYFQEGQKLKKQVKHSRQRLKENKILSFFDPLPIIDPLNRFKMELEGRRFTPFLIKAHPKDDNLIIVRTQLSNGVLNFYVPEKRITSSSKYVFILWMVLSSLLASAVSVIFLRNQIKSIKGLSIAAEKLGRGGDAPDFKPSGAKEIRSVGISFIRMKERIVRQISQRTQMLFAVSHDLRTPLTRMKLQLEMMENSEATNDLKSDISDMEKMINEYLDFAKSGGAEREKAKDVNINEFLQKMADYYQKMDRDISYISHINPELKMTLKKNALKRAIRNLIDNSFHYGTKVLITAETNKHNLKIIVDDNGCGISPNERENIFKPFYRIDNSRNLDKKPSSNSGGAGLGLAIVMDVISSFGGKINVDDSPLGGLRMVIHLPL
ncbi:MAG: putative two-component sensor histidine kinase [Rickettsiaceae bacterium]|jgi:two-component system osmolarity sensor histidine kinase EnvZ|nr:putative two-component sensor histidine kinase [Rickettsiaceae bacterium]